MIARAAIAMAVISAGLLGWQLLHPAPANRVAGLTAPASQPSPAPAAENTSPASGPVTPAQAESIRDDLWGATLPAAPQPMQLDADAIDALQRTRQGDSRAPAIGDDERLRPLASDDLRNDYSDYQQWQNQHRLAGYARYVTAANEKLAQIDEHLSWGAQNGVSEQDLAAAREKRARLAASRDQLLADYPELEAAEADTLSPINDDSVDVSERQE